MLQISASIEQWVVPAVASEMSSGILGEAKKVKLNIPKNIQMLTVPVLGPILRSSSCPKTHMCDLKRVLVLLEKLW